MSDKIEFDPKNVTGRFSQPGDQDGTKPLVAKEGDGKPQSKVTDTKGKPLEIDEGREFGE